MPGGGLRSYGSGTRVNAIDCVSKNNYDGFYCACHAQCVVSGSRSVGNGCVGYRVDSGGHMTVTDCSSERDIMYAYRYNDGGTLKQERLRVDRV